jgi:SAM-dependent methyltransferase
MDVLPGDRVLDVACGSGNTAIAAARYFAEVTGIDFVPALLERGRVRAAAELLEVEFVEGDAQELPFEELAWGTEERLRELFGSGISELRVERCVTTQRFRSSEHFLEFFCSYFGPVVEAFGRVEAGREEAFAAELKAVARKFARRTYGGHHG